LHVECLAWEAYLEINRSIAAFNKRWWECPGHSFLPREIQAKSEKRIWNVANRQNEVSSHFDHKSLFATPGV